MEFTVKARCKKVKRVVMGTLQRLLTIIADGAFYSGSDLARILGVSRSTVNNYMKKLGELGLDIHSVPGKGYQLSVPLELLDIQAMQEPLGLASLKLISNIEIKFQLPSTNSYLMSLVRAEPQSSGVACFAEMQFAGRGRRGKLWVSPVGENIYLSVLWRFQQAPVDFACLGLAMAVAVARAVKRIGLDLVRIKWPNDIYLNGRKMGGILLEMSGESQGPCSVVVGIGLNVSMNSFLSRYIDQKWTSLKHHFDGDVSRNKVAGIVLEELVLALRDFQRSGFENFKSEWRQYDVIKGRQVILKMERTIIKGLALGIDKSGALLIERNGKVERFFHGEVSVCLD
ncbi:Biotin operon repressor / Biotin--protein ligase [hydrothermal vent metagenome]|uniref:Biotin operon repressor / Biotin--protein ligase n=1 Tax=hydrothermal vent metagenome TaxID=652676 RepID=A0A3B0ZGM8_9ZZZZ